MMSRRILRETLRLLVNGSDILVRSQISCSRRALSNINSKLRPSASRKPGAVQKEIQGYLHNPHLHPTADLLLFQQNNWQSFPVLFQASCRRPACPCTNWIISPRCGCCAVITQPSLTPG
ncbi:hypothetical protein SKAU_G00023620 [Synaphobranchus kaupii]|uniref:Uncharacterized protein n=1 Tax=Synaphobranchus kaupii TaxID=118154 RepID=A0A9Q1JEW9_SYNKA|nr:hypothetical protein SKAU_G00023620 [Synaphobranchus kaupii]